MSSLPLLILLGVIGPWQVVIIVALILVLFGGKKIPELMRGMGRGIKSSDAVNKTIRPKRRPSQQTTKPTDDDQIVSSLVSTASRPAWGAFA
ncbi:MAG: twin-arginine translocase TatA/TatE family subunit [Alistipes sp.]